MLTRLTSGIAGLDSIIQEGFPFPSTLVLKGDTGSGKTTFGMQFLSEGAKKGEQSLYITTLSESVQWMLKFLSEYDFINKEYFGEEIKYLDLGQQLRTMKSGEELLSVLNESYMEILPQRVVIDPITVIKLIIPDEYRSFLFDLSVMVKNWQSITLLTGEINHNDNDSRDEEYIADGVILLYNRLEDMKRRNYLEILKMRGTAPVKGLHPYEISKAGIQIFRSD
jgi:circadian clock protein KaiC